MKIFYLNLLCFSFLQNSLQVSTDDHKPPNFFTPSPNQQNAAGNGVVSPNSNPNSNPNPLNSNTQSNISPGNPNLVVPLGFPGFQASPNLNAQLVLTNGSNGLNTAGFVGPQQRSNDVNANKSNNTNVNTNTNMNINLQNGLMNQDSTPSSFAIISTQPENHPLNQTEKPVQSIDGIIDLLKTFTGNTTLDSEKLKEHLLQKTSEHAKEDATDLKNADLKSKRKEQIEHFREEEREKLAEIIHETATENATIDMITSTTISTTTTVSTTTTTIDPVNEVAKNPSLQKKLLEKLLVQDVAKGDTQVMESIVEDVNETLNLESGPKSKNETFSPEVRADLSSDSFENSNEIDEGDRHGRIGLRKLKSSDEKIDHQDEVDDLEDESSTDQDSAADIDAKKKREEEIPFY